MLSKICAPNHILTYGKSWNQNDQIGKQGFWGREEYVAYVTVCNIYLGVGS